MEEPLEMARSKDTKERMAGVERLHQHLESSTKTLTSSEVTSLVDLCTDLLKDNNFRVSQGALQALSSAAVLSGEHLKLHFNGLVPAVVERLGDGKQPVRDAARQLLVTLMEVSSPTIIVERAGSYAWAHKSWRVREEFARTVATAVGLFASTELTLQRVLLPPVLQLVNDPNYSVREAAASCIEEMYRQVGPQFREELQRQYIPSSMMKEINARLEKIEPKVNPSDRTGTLTRFVPIETKSFNSVHKNKRGSPRSKSTPRETSFYGATGEADVTEKPVDPIKVYSEKELIREIEKIASTLVPEKDWSLRIAAMQRIEGLVFGGATNYPSLPMILKQLVPPLSTQLLDRRSSIVKQACHLLNLLSKELLGDFEACAELFIPVLFKLVVITVLVIAESADNCIKTMLRNSKVARVLPRIADSAKNDRNAVLRARCCEYALLILEYWADAPEIQRSADVYENLIKCCVADAMSEVRSTARTCYRMFTKTWPERSRRLFLSFDPVIQRIINDEDGGLHKRYASPSLRERGGQLSQAPSHSPTSYIPGYGTSAIVAMGKNSAIASGVSLSSGSRLSSQSKTSGNSVERDLETMLHASKQKVSAIESLLRGVNLSDKSKSSITQSTSLDLGFDTPSARDPLFPPAVSGSSNLYSQNSLDSAVSDITRGVVRNGDSDLTDLIGLQNHALNDSTKSSHQSKLSSDSPSALSLATVRKSSGRSLDVSIEENNDIRSTRRFTNMQTEKQFVDTHYKESAFRDSHSHYVPNFQRPLIRRQATGRVSASGRNSFDDSQSSFAEMFKFVDGPASLNDALTEGLTANSDWAARVSAFNYLRNLLQQGSRGVQEVTQNFDKVMKLFFRHLDDPHHKVAQAALQTLAEVIPACRKPFESYIERILPSVFSRLIDPKELVRKPCTTTLEIVGRTYSIDSLLPALLRSLDEQRSPKAKLAVIDFANNSFNKHAANSDSQHNSGFLKLWLAKLAPLVYDKNTKLKEASISGIISVYSHFDSTAVLNFILSLSVQEQNSLRRALKQYTPRIEVDLMNFLQNKKERQRSKSFYDPSDVTGTSSEEGYIGTSRKSQLFGRYSAGSVDSEGERKWSSMQEPALDVSIGQSTSDDIRRPYQNIELNFDTDADAVGQNSREMKYNANNSVESTRTWMNVIEKSDQSIEHDSPSETPRLDINKLLNYNGSRATGLSPSNESTRTWMNVIEKSDQSIEHDSSSGTPRLDINKLLNYNGSRATGLSPSNESIQDKELACEKLNPAKNNSQVDNGPCIPQILHQICIGSDDTSALSKREALQQLIEASIIKNTSVWTKYFNQILTAVLEVLDYPDSSTKELALSLVVEMLKNQKEAMEDSVEIVTEKLLHTAKDGNAKVSNEAHQCLTILLAQYDPFRCLTVIVPLLASDDEKILVICINCLTKLVGRFSQEELITQLPSFLPALFDAFGSQSPDVRKTVVFCLVDIYIILGKTFLPYLEGLSSTQLRLVTIYANRISQARTGTAIDANH